MHFGHYDALMATQNPRITVTLQPETYALVRELSRLNGASLSATIGGMLDEVSPVLHRVVKVLHAAEMAKASVRGNLVSDLEAAQSKVEERLGLALDAFTGCEQPLLDMFDQVERRSPKTSGKSGVAAPAGEGSRASGRVLGGRSPTPPSNRGVRFDPEKPKKPVSMRVPAQIDSEEKIGVNPTGKRAKNGGSK